jgi:rod shape-determining protein MreD
VNATSVRATVALTLLLLLAGGLQSTVSYRFAIGGGQPDFVLVIALTAALLSNARVGGLVGFAAGLITAGLTGQTVGTYIVTRTLVGFLAGGLSGRFLRVHVVTVAVCAGIGALTAELLYGLSVPRSGFLPIIRAAGIGAIGNGVAALFAAVLLRRLGWGEDR